jgi:predicted O-linked N-acetylglucosamine transferase (SPINDLY family)
MNAMAQTLEQALTLHRGGNLQQAELLYRQILQADPAHADALHLLGVIAHQAGRNDAAVELMQRAIRIHPDFPEAHNNLGTALAALGKTAAAVACHREAVRLMPGFAEAHNNLGNALNHPGHVEEAFACYRRALALKPDFAVAHFNLGNALKEQGQLDEAVASYRQALNCDPDYAEAHINLGNALKGQGRLDEAIAAFRQALTLRPDSASFHSNLVFILSYHPDHDAVSLCQEAGHWNARHAEPLAPARLPHANDADPERRLRVGYVSPDFCRHALAHVLLPLLSNHDHQSVEIFCYAEVQRPDDMTDRLRRHADHWRPTVGVGDETLASVVRQDRIDILVDLALHSANNRLLVFARKPAPVQVSWLGYPGTTGLATIDYRLTDPYLDPPGTDDLGGGEKLIRLPDTFWCYDPSMNAPVNQLPALANGIATFGCLSNFCKVNDQVLVLWAQVLRAIPGSRLLLLAPIGSARDHVSAVLRDQGIEERRLEFVSRQTRHEYFQVYHRIDLCLDSFPYNGHTTSLDAFWMGVPTITRVGKTAVGRAGWSQLVNLGLPELAAHSPEEFVSIVVRLAGDLPGLQELRAGLRERLCRSPLMDGRRFARNMENVFRQIWREWCKR